MAYIAALPSSAVGVVVIEARNERGITLAHTNLRSFITNFITHYFKFCLCIGEKSCGKFKKYLKIININNENNIR